LTQQDYTGVNLVHVHQCYFCGRYSLPEQFSARDMARGLYECPFCHSSAALNVRIVSRSEVEEQS
jgi:hypothetical protein